MTLHIPHIARGRRAAGPVCAGMTRALVPRLARHQDPHALNACWRARTCPGVGRMLDHRCHRRRAAHAHVADAYLVAAAERVGPVIAGAMARAGSRLRAAR